MAQEMSTKTTGSELLTVELNQLTTTPNYSIADTRLMNCFGNKITNYIVSLAGISNVAQGPSCR